LKFVSLSGIYEEEEDGSIFNADEVNVVGTIARQLIGDGVLSDEIVVVTGYHAQARKIASILPNIAVKTFSQMKVCLLRYFSTDLYIYIYICI